MIEAAGRLFRVFVAPGETFRELREKPTWGLGLVVYWALAATAAYLLVSRVDFAEVLESQIAASGGQAPSNLEQGAAFARGCVALLFFGFRLFGGDFNFRQSLSIVVHGLMPRAAAALASIPVILSRKSFSAEEMKTASFLHSNLGFLAPENPAPWLSVLLISLDVFTLGALVLLSLGYHVAGGVSRTRAFLGVFGLWVLSVAAQMGLAALPGLR